MADLKKNNIFALSLSSYLGKTALEMHEMLTIAFGDNAMVEHRLLNGSLASDLEKLGGESCVLRLSLKLHR